MNPKKSILKQSLSIFFAMFFFLANAQNPFIENKGQLPRYIYKEAAQLGVLAPGFPEVYGGLGNEHSDLSVLISMCPFPILLSISFFHLFVAENFHFTLGTIKFFTFWRMTPSLYSLLVSS